METDTRLRGLIVSTHGLGTNTFLASIVYKLANFICSGVPGIIISRRGLRGYGPERRAQLNSPAGYPES